MIVVANRDTIVSKTIVKLEAVWAVDLKMNQFAHK